MSRIGAKPISIPEGVTVDIKPDSVSVSGPLGSLVHPVEKSLEVKRNGSELVVERKNNAKRVKSLHGLLRAVIKNMIQGVTEGWQKTLEIQGTGYRVQLDGNKLVFNIGFSHSVEFTAPEGIKFEVKENHEIIVFGINKILVGNTAAKIRIIRPPDAYKGKGIRYQGEVVKLKPGKAGKAGAAGGAGA